MNNPTFTTLFAALIGAAIMGCAVPDIEAPAGEIPLMTVAAQGVQIYECSAKPGAPLAWTFVVPRADLFDANGRQVGHHGAGPSWQHQDGSGFVASLRSPAESQRPGTIPWLLLAARPQGTDSAFARVTSVQRLNTRGGQPPSAGCPSANQGARVQVAYSADYVPNVPAATVGKTVARYEPTGKRLSGPTSAPAAPDTVAEEICGRRVCMP